MSSSMPSLPTDFKQKSFWERPEGPAGKILLALMIGAAGWGLYLLLPFLITLLSNLLMASLLAVGLGLLWLAIYSFRNLVFYMFRGMARSVAKWYTEVDPMNIMESYIEDLQKLLEDMRKNALKVIGIRKEVEQTIVTNKREMNMALIGTKKAIEEKDKRKMVLNSRMAGRRQQSGLTYERLLGKLQMIERVFKTVDETCEFMILDTTDEVKMRKREYNAILATESVISAAKKILHGEAAKRQLFDMATETVNERIAQGYANLEQFTAISQRFIDSVDLQNGLYEEEALSMLEDWEKKADQIVLGDGKSLDIASLISNDQAALDLSTPVSKPVAASQRMRDLVKGVSSEQ